MQETDQLIKSDEPKHTRNVIHALINEYKIMYNGLTNQEYLDYCFVKGACAQTVPLALLLPIGLLLGTVNILSKAITNIIQGDFILTNIIQVVLQIIALCIVLYLLLKACEVIPKKIENPLLFGKVTTYVFMCLLIAMGILVVERIVEGQARTYHTSQFWVVFALVIWQKILVLFIYDYKIRFAAFLFLYVYYAFRVSGEEFRWAYNLIKASVYICLEFVMVVDRELKNYADYQIENNVQKKSIIEEITPPMRMFQQQFLLESFLKVFPLVIFDQTKELLNISQQALRLLDEKDLYQAERKLRKLEIVEIFNKKENSAQQTVKLTRQAKFGSTCGVNEKGELLHSLINGPALQQLRVQQQSDQPRIQTQGQLEQLLSQLIKGDQEYLKGLLVLKLSKDKQIYFAFHLLKQHKIYLFLDDVTEIVKLQSNKVNQEIQTFDYDEAKYLCQKIRQASTLNNYPLQTKIINIETKICYLQQNSLKINYQKIDFEQMTQQLQQLYSQKISTFNKFSVKNLSKISVDFYSDEDKIKQIIDILMENSIDNTNDGYIGITIENDTRSNQICISVLDTGTGIKMEQLNDESNKNISSIFIANYLSKILGKSQYNQKLNGNVACKGLRVITTQECGTKISFSIRNMLFDENISNFFMDEDVEEDEQNQDDIMERYLIDDQTLFLKRLKKPIKFIVSKPTERKDIPQSIGAMKRPQLKGMMKLQESGRLKSLKIETLQIVEPQVCSCIGVLLINSDYYFTNFIKDFNFTIANEKEALKLINIKIKENPCIQEGCMGFKKIIINCSNPKVDYLQLIIKLQNLNKNLNIIALTYNPYDEIPQNIVCFQMPQKLDILYQ